MAGVYPDCSTCDRIWQLLVDPDAKDRLNLGSCKQAYGTECVRHGPLIRNFIDWCRENESSEIDESEDIGFRPGGRGRSVSLFSSITKLGHTWRIMLLHDDSASNHPGTGRVMNPDWVDLEILKQWKADCFSLHGSRCENPMKIFKVQPAWVIDVEEMCLVPGVGHDNFVAVSYRAGDSLNPITSSDIVARLREPNSLIDPGMASCLTPIARHAVYLTKDIGERYLWIDSLCLNHGDRKTLVDQLHLMAAIYASATLTIIGADFDAETGLLGLETVSPSRELRQRVIPFGNEKLAARNTGMFSMTTGTPYYQRGWTYQEFEMSQRKILFNRKEIHWQCQCSVWHEELRLGIEMDKYINPRLNVLLAGFPDFDSLGHALCMYNERSLTYDEDALPGISGLLAVTSRAFSGGFLFGLPELFFDRALSWRPMWNFTDLRRRTISDRSTSSYLTDPDLPSWSWIGWQGLISNSYGEAIRINQRQTKISETIPITDWYTSKSPEDPPSRRRRIRATWFENRKRMKDTATPLPKGWTRYPAPKLATNEAPLLYPDGCGDFVYKHENMPDADCDSWYYPFPVVDISSSTRPFIPEQTPYLFCETKKATLWAHQKQSSEPHHEIIITLRSKSCVEIGMLHRHNSEQEKLFPKNLEDDALGMPVTLVAINQLRRHNQTWDSETRRYIHPVTITEVYTVLWVEERDGVYYRLASGEVNKESWESLDLDAISLVLG